MIAKNTEKASQMSDEVDVKVESSDKKSSGLNIIHEPSEDSALDEDPDSWFLAIETRDEKIIKDAVSKKLSLILGGHGLLNYNILFLFDDIRSISSFHSDKLYASSFSNINKDKDIFLIVQSTGGSIEPAYLISKALKKLSHKRFVVAVPRRAKSAATLLSLGADEIHMGLMSQLGPIDPQFRGLPALGLGDALDTIADLACRFPSSSKMLSAYLTENLRLDVLGYFNRVSASAVQYAERLLAGKILAANNTPQFVAEQLVNHYKDHGFVIDIDEARHLLGGKIVKYNTPEYKAADEVFQFFDFLSFVINKYCQKQFSYIGNIENGLTLSVEPTEES